MAEQNVSGKSINLKIFRDLESKIFKLLNMVEILQTASFTNAVTL